ncbi:MAG: hypothetical protein MJZ68_03990 [archaeon]|nr:hypothetical protein [archaeon]
MNYMSRTLASIIVAIAMVSVAIVSDALIEPPHEPSHTTGLDGVWHQTLNKGYYNGSRYDTVTENSDLVLHLDGEYVFGKHRGYDFVGMYCGTFIIWSYDTETGNFYVQANTYDDCIVVNEVFNGNGLIDKTTVTSSLYTKTGHVPKWFEYWDIPLDSGVWDLYSGRSVNEINDVKLDGTHFYMLENYGSVFKAEMEQISSYLAPDPDSEGDTIEIKKITTRPLTGVLVELSEGCVRAVLTENEGRLWYLHYNNDVLSLRTVMMSQLQEFNNKAVYVERVYMPKYQSFNPDIPSVPFEKGDRMEVSLGRSVFFDGTVVTHEIKAVFEISNVYGSGFIANGHDESYGNIQFIAFMERSKVNPEYLWMHGMFYLKDYVDPESERQHPNKFNGFGIYSPQEQTVRFGTYDTTELENQYLELITFKLIPNEK